MEDRSIIIANIRISELEELIRKIVKSEFSALQEKSSPEKEELITRKAACALLGITAPTIIEWSKRGLIQFYRCGANVRYKRSEVMALHKEVKWVKHNRSG